MLEWLSAVCRPFKPEESVKTVVTDLVLRHGFPNSTTPKKQRCANLWLSRAGTVQDHALCSASPSLRQALSAPKCSDRRDTERAPECTPVALTLALFTGTLQSQSKTEVGWEPCFDLARCQTILSNSLRGGPGELLSMEAGCVALKTSSF